MIATLGAITIAAAALWYGGRKIREEQGKRSIFSAWRYCHQRFCADTKYIADEGKKPLNQKEGTDARMNSSDVSKVVVGK
jgi:hypothetical protein